jgi:putative transcriptional regulator
VRTVPWLPAVLAAAMTGTLIVTAGIAAPRARQLQPGDVRTLSRGKILVAATELGDPHFAETVVLLVQHSAQASMGVIINRKSDVPLLRLLPELPKSATPPLVFMGGPVVSSGVIALVRLDAPQKDAHLIVDGIYQITAPDLLNAQITAGAGADRLRVYYGYAGWSGGQLERETRAGGWHVFEGTAKIVFDADPDSLWRRQIPRADQRVASREGNSLGRRGRSPTPGEPTAASR